MTRFEIELPDSAETVFVDSDYSKVHDNGALAFMRQDGCPILTYAPGAWIAYRRRDDLSGTR